MINNIIVLIPNFAESCEYNLRLRAIKKLVRNVDIVDMSTPATLWYRIANKLFQLGLPVSLPDTAKVNSKIKSRIKSKVYDVIWVEKGLVLWPETLDYIKRSQPNAVLVNMTPDNMMERPWQSKQYLKCIPYYDYHITTKPFIIDKFYQKGAKNVICVNKTYQSDFHYPRELTIEDRKRLGADVGFVGTWDQERCDSMIFLAKNGIKVKVYGEKEWKRYVGKVKNLTIVPHSLYDDDYAKSISAFKISLCFLKKRAFDTTTNRSVEIPACGGFMLAERTSDHLKLFEEGKEAAYFDTNEELLEKCNYYLAHEEERKAIADAGRKRCLKSDYTNEAMLKNVFETIKMQWNERA